MNVNAVTDITGLMSVLIKAGLYLDTSQHKRCHSPSSVCGTGAGASSTAAGGPGSDFFTLDLGCLDSLEASDSEDICKGSIFP